MASCSLTDQFETGTGGTTHTKTCAIGAENAARKVIVAASWRDSATSAITGITIGGNAAGLIESFHNEYTGGRSGVDFYWLPVPTGTTAEIIVTYGEDVDRGNFWVYTTTDNVAPEASVGTDGLDSVNQASPQVLTLSVNVPVDSFVIGAANIASNDGARVWAWAGLTEDADTLLAPMIYTAAHINDASASTPLAITATFTSDDSQNFQSVGMTVVFAPVAGGLSIPIAYHHYRTMHA